MLLVNHFSRTHAKWSLIAFAICFPLVGTAATAVTARFRNDITSWADPESQQAQEFAAYRRDFGPGEFVLLALPQVETANPETAQQPTKPLRSLSDRLKGPAAKRWFKRVTHSDDIRRYLADDLRLSPSQVRQRASDLLVDADGQFDSLVFELTDAARQDRTQAFSLIDNELASLGVDIDQVRFAGLGHDLHVLDHDGLTSPFKMVPWIMLVAFSLTFFFLKDLPLAVFINAFGTFTGCLSFTLIYLSGVSLNAILWPSPTLIMLLSISGALHLLAYYRSAIQMATGALAQRNDDAIKQMMSEGGKPIVLCAVTTALGMASLMLSSTQPVRQFGIFGSLSVIASCGLLLVLLPAWLTVFPPLRLIQRESASPSSSTKLDWSLLTSFAIRRRVSIVVVLSVVMFVGAMAVPKIKTGGNLRNFFPSDHRIIKDSEVIESNLGPLSSIEVLLRFQNSNEENDLSRVRMIGAITRKMVNETSIESVLSASTFAPRLTRRDRGLQVVVDKQKIRRLKSKWQDAGLVHIDPKDSTETWRLSARYSGLSEMDVPKLAAQLKSIAETQYVAAPVDSETLKVSATGEFVLFDFVDRQFSRDLLLTYSTAFLLISLVIVAIVGSIRIALVCTLPNLFPALVVLGGAGLLGRPLDVASLMTASLVLGIAVDDTLHFVIRWRGDVSRGIDCNQALENAMKHVGSAMVQTSVICGFSIFLYAFCGFLPTVRFGILLAAMLFAALVGDLLLLPALLTAADRGAQRAQSNNAH